MAGISALNFLTESEIKEEMPYIDPPPREVVSERQRSFPFTEQESSLLIDLYLANKERYHGKPEVVTANGAVMSPMDLLAMLWANKITRLGVRKRTPQQIKRKIIDMRKTANALLKKKAQETPLKPVFIPRYIQPLVDSLESAQKDPQGSKAVTPSGSGDPGIDLYYDHVLFNNSPKSGGDVALSSDQPDSPNTTNGTMEAIFKDSSTVSKRPADNTVEGLQIELLREEILLCKMKVKKEEQDMKMRAELHEMQMRTEQLKQEEYTGKTIE